MLLQGATYAPTFIYGRKSFKHIYLFKSLNFFMNLLNMEILKIQRQFGKYIRFRNHFLCRKNMLLNKSDSSFVFKQYLIQSQKSLIYTGQNTHL